jgi:azurin
LKNSTIRQAAFAGQLRSGHLTSIPLDPDALRSIARIDSPELKLSYLEPAQKALSLSGAVQDAALFSLGHIPGNDTKIFAALAKHVVNPDLTASAVEAILTRPEETWPAEAAAALLDTQLPILKSTPVEKRGSASFELASKLLTIISTIRKAHDTVAQIRSLQLVPVEVATVPDQLRFDQNSIRVPANTPVELRLNNPDVIQHNLVLCAPNSLEKVGRSVDKILADPKAIERDWIPDLPEVLHATPMAKPHQKVVLRFITPKKPGSYPFLCTVPGHWRIMHGTMIVDKPNNLSSSNKANKHVLILTGEPEYGTRSSLSELGKKLEKDHQLKITHLEIDRSENPHRFPDLSKHLPKADLLILSLRFVNLEESQFKALDQHLTHKPFIAVRTTTHLFDFPKNSKLAGENREFPTRHLGTPYRGHHGHESSQVNYVMSAKHPVMTGIDPRFWTPDFHYAVNPLDIECTPLMIGQALRGRQRATFKKVGGHNHAMVLSAEDQKRISGSPHPVVWTIESKPNRRALATTIGARKSFEDPNVQRLYRNAVLWSLGYAIPKP